MPSGSHITRSLLLASVAIPLVACDQAAKAIARRTLEYGELIEFLGGFVRFQLTENSGGFLSLGSSLPDPLRMLLFYVAVPIGLVLLVVSIVRSSPALSPAMWGIALVVGGGAGNLIDRFANDGAVVDFVSVGLDGLRTGIFNVADVAIMAGAGLVAWGGFRSEPSSDPGPDRDPDPDPDPDRDRDRDRDPDRDPPDPESRTDAAPRSPAGDPPV